MNITKIEPGSEMHLSLLMAPYGLQFFSGEDHDHLLSFAKDVWEAARTQAQMEILQLQDQVQEYRDAYTNMRDWAEQNGVDTKAYYPFKVD